VLNGVIISGGRNIKIGDGCFIGRNVLLDARGGEIDIGDGAEIRDGVRIYSTGIKIGRKVTLGEGAYLNGQIEVGDEAWIARECSLGGRVLMEKAILGPRVSCFGSTGHQRDPETGAVLMSSKGRQIGNDQTDGKIRICKGSWVGSGTIILKNVILAPNAVVGAGSVVTKNFPENTVIAGNPAKEIHSRLNSKSSV
jgi:acetyltransferase-like isoleucine patch superfamily enzyme